MDLWERVDLSLGVSKTNWDIGISLILCLNLGYWLTEIGILGYQLQIWDIAHAEGV